MKKIAQVASQAPLSCGVILPSRFLRFDSVRKVCVDVNYVQYTKHLFLYVEKTYNHPNEPMVSAFDSQFQAVVEL